MSAAINSLQKAAESSKDFARLEVSSNSDSLWVIFSHVDVPPGKFAQTGVFKHLEGNKLFLNCRDNAWYIRGVPGFSHDIASTVSRLADLVRPFKTCFVGHSMGAYLSLICGNIIPGSRFIATSPEFHLNLVGSRAHRNGVKVSGEWGDVSKLRHRFHNRPTGQIYMGAYDPVDAYFLAHLDDVKGLGDVFEVPHHHGVTEFFTSNGIYLNILSGNKSKLHELELRGFLNATGSSGTPQQYEMFYELFRLHQEGVSFDETGSLLSDHAEWGNPGWQETRAKLFRNFLKTDDALAAAERAYLFQGNVIEYISIYASAAANAQQLFTLDCVIAAVPDRLHRHPSFQKIVEMRSKLYQKNMSDGVRQTAIPCAYDLSGLPDNFPKRLSHDRLPEKEEPEFGALLENQDWLKILEHTHHIYGSTNDKNLKELYWLRGKALLETGETGLLVRHILIAVQQFPRSLKLAKLLLNIARRVRSSVLVWRFFEMNVEHGKLSYVVKQLQSCLVFIRDPNLASRIFVFGLDHAVKPEQFESIVHKRLLQSGMVFAVGKNLRTKAFEPKLNANNVNAYVSFMSRAGQRRSASELLKLYQSELPDDLFLSNQQKLSEIMVKSPERIKSFS